MGSCLSVRIKAESPLHHGKFLFFLFQFFNLLLCVIRKLRRRENHLIHFCGLGFVGL